MIHDESGLTPAIARRPEEEINMRIGKVVGTVVASQKDEGLESLKLLVVQIYSHEHEPLDDYVVAVDSVQAGLEDIVLYATGSSARQTAITENKPCDAVIMAIVDSWDIEGRQVYRKWA